MAASMRVTVLRNGNRALKQLERINRALSGPSVVRVGLPRNSNAYPDGTSVVMVGAVHEFGNDVVPERSFLRSTMHEERKKYKRQARRLLRRVIAGQITARAALGLLGTEAENDVVQKIRDIDTPPLKVRVGGNPLWDTGHMAGVITHVVGGRKR